MAIFSLHHQPIGKTSQKQPHTAAAHIRYITRPQAASFVDAERMPLRPSQAANHLKQMEDGDRKNARVVDKLRLALPVELSAPERAALVREYAEDVTQGRAPWLAAFHDQGEDAHNPHCHLVVRDRDHETGKRVMGTSEAGSTERLRSLWELHVNRALERAGRAERIDRRTLAAQGIARAPTIHEGPKAQAMDARGAAPTSQRRNVRNGRGARERSRMVDYPAIDKGRSRPAYNRQVRPRESAADYWAAIDADKQQREFQGMGFGADARRYYQQRKPAMADESPQGKKQGLLTRIGSKVADTAQRADQKMADFLHDPSKPVKTGKDAPEVSNTRDWTTRPQTPEEQQQMSIPEAVYKKGVKPALGAAKEWLAPKAAEKSGQQVAPVPTQQREAEKPAQQVAPALKPLSFTERLAQQREAERTDPALAQQRREKDLARLKQGREQEKERGR